ncbi:hypothetical protein [Micromonospora sp. RP3T]|uniref:hypothetical protein n=1 Tax=Micromonospora sp. RP3T TaxID=2135446 RepID=UPI000D15D76B|nr:hypothetical protein [Micromonospora sp. RP3T]PTA42917.1 hypothetical protein C8054_28255 [Micromonospora sp. RP3T]
MPALTRAACLVSLAAALITGCSAAEPGAEPAVPVVAQVANAAAELRLPLDEYELTPSGNQQVQRAVFDRLRSCLTTFDLAVTLPEARVATYPAHATQLNWLGGHDVTRYGYQGPPGFVEEMSAAARRGSRPIVVPPEAVAVFYGDTAVHHGRRVPAKGCDGESQRAVNGGIDPTSIDGLAPGVSPEKGIEWLEQQAADQARADRRYLHVVDRWRACMERQGHHYATPDDAQGDPRWNREEDGGPSPSPDEVATATADRSCRDATNMSGVLRNLIAQREDQIIRTRPDTVRQVSALLHRRAENAAALLHEPLAG